MRGGALANLIAAKLPGKLGTANKGVYAYTFESPATTDASLALTGSGQYSYIHNYLSGDDIVPLLPMWGMVRYGNEYELKSEETELALADLDTCEKAMHRLEKKAKGGDKDAQASMKVLEKCLPVLNDCKKLLTLDLSDEEKLLIRECNFLTLKPTMYIANVAEDGFSDNPYLDQVNAIAEKEGAVVVPVCAAVESDLASMEDDERQEFLESLGLDEPGLNRVIRAGYKLLKLHTYFTAGEKEVRAWTIPVGATAPKAAGKIHTDFEKGFIRANTISYDDYIAYNGEAGAKEAGKMRAEGKDYIVHDGDVITFLFNVKK